MIFIWTKSQQKAISIRDKNVLVAAAAGSGKTAVLVERIIKIITDEELNVDVDKLLVVTFSNAAAAEMKERVFKALEKVAAENTSSSHIKRQLAIINRAKIITIHAFCLEVIRENYSVIGIDPNFKIADQKELDIIKDQVLEELFQEMYERDNNENFLNLIDCFAENKGHEKVKLIILDIFKFLQSIPFYEDWLIEKIEYFNIENRADFNNTFFGKLLLKNLNFIIDKVLSFSDAAIDVMEKNNASSVYKELLYKENDFIKSLNPSNLDNLFDVINEFKFETIPSTTRATKAGIDSKVSAKIKTLRTTYKDILVKKVKTLYFRQDINKSLEEFSYCYDYLSAIKDVIIEFKEAFSNYKLKNLLIDFSDFEHYCLKILINEDGEPSDVALNMKNTFYEVLIDEYQDTNDVQELIMQTVSNGNNRFMVGDVKQSIYKFRSSRPEIFMKKYADFSVADIDEKIDLSKNFRSRDTILNGINFIFSQIMNETIGEVVYDEDAMLHLGTDYLENDNLNVGGDIEIDIFAKIVNKKSKDDIDDTNDTLDEIENILDTEKEILQMIIRIKDLINSDYHVFDKDLNDYRHVSYKDIAVLMRSLSLGLKFNELFEQHEVPLYVETKNGFFKSPEIMTIVSFLQIIDNPLQDIPLIAILNSPFYKLSGDMLLSIALQNSKKPFFSNVKYYAETFDDELSKILNTFLNDMKEYRNFNANNTVSELIWHIYTETNYFNYLTLLPNGEVCKANLKVLLEQAKDYEASSFKGLYHFVKYIEKMEKNETDMPKAKVLYKNNDVVTIMTIHKSKGLEFPVVIVGGLSNSFSTKDFQKSVLLHKDYGFGTTLIKHKERIKKTTLPREIITQIMKKENLSEELRLFYVALTRAREKLILIGVVKNIETSISNWTLFADSQDPKIPAYIFFNAKSYLDLIMPALIRHKDFKFELKEKNVTVFSYSNDISNEIFDYNSKFKFNITNEMPEIVHVTKAKSLNVYKKIKNWNHEKYDTNEELFKMLNWEYGNKSSCELPKNLSISEIKRRFSNEEFKNSVTNSITFKTPDFLSASEGFSAAEKGTFIHTIFEQLPYDKKYHKDDIDLEIKKIVDRNILTEDELDAIDITKVVDFFGSNIYDRLLTSSEIYKEKPFAISMTPYEIFKDEKFLNIKEKILIHGIVDCFFIENGGIILLDYKSDFVTKKNKRSLVEKYKIQMEFYKLALEKTTNYKVLECYIYATSINEFLVVDLD